MAEVIPQEVEDALSEQVEAPPKSKKKLFIIIGAVLFLAAGQFFVMKFMFGSSDSVDTETADAIPEIEDHVTEVEISIGNFNCTNRTASQGTDIHVSFDLTALVPGEMKDSFKNDLNDVYKNRVKQAVEEVIRGASLAELDSDDKKTLKRKIKEDINKVMNRTYITELIINDFRTL